MPASTSGIIESAVAAATPPYALRAIFVMLCCTPCNCDTLTASVGFTPGATFVMRRSAPCEPTDTVFASLAIEPVPSATELGELAEAFWPSATALLPDATAFAPIAVAPSPAAVAPWPSAELLDPPAVAPVPMATAFTPLPPSLLKLPCCVPLSLMLT